MGNASKSGKSKKKVAKKANKQLILKALTDPKFRRQINSDPAAALKKKSLTKIQKKEVELVLAAVKGIESQMNVMADKLLCACGVIV